MKTPNGIIIELVVRLVLATRRGANKMSERRTEFHRVISVLNRLLSRESPNAFNSSWIIKFAPACYRFFYRHVRAHFGGIDWDKITSALDRNHQRRWKPRRRPRPKAYADADEINGALEPYRERLYVFVAAVGYEENRLRDLISIPLVRLAQKGNILASQQLMELVPYTVDTWMERHEVLGRWQWCRAELQNQIQGCIRRYRYTGSFMRYLRATLEYAARGLRPIYACSFDEQLALN
jgi:hypothetical protein